MSRTVTLWEGDVWLGKHQVEALRARFPLPPERYEGALRMLMYEIARQSFAPEEGVTYTATVNPVPVWIEYVLGWVPGGHWSRMHYSSVNASGTFWRLLPPPPEEPGR